MQLKIIELSEKPALETKMLPEVKAFLPEDPRVPPVTSMTNTSQEEEEEDVGEDVENEPMIFSNDEDWDSDDEFIASEKTPSEYSDSDVEWISEDEERF